MKNTEEGRGQEFMAQQDTQSPGGKREADLRGDLIQSCPQILIVYAM